MFIDEFYINFLLGFFTALFILGLFFWHFYQKSLAESRVLAYDNKEKDATIRTLELSLTTYKERLSQHHNIKEQMYQEFSNIANNIIAHNSNTLARHNQQNIDAIIKPFKEHIDAYHDRLESFYNLESKERFSLTKEIQSLQALNQQISQDAINLTNALKGNNKIQGDWGEMILERILENSGLQKGREYVIQESFKDEQAKLLRPDVIIKLPENREVIIDAKVSLTAYERYYHDDQAKEKHLKDFLSSLQAHIKLLSSKKYQKIDGIETLDFVLLFIPIEGAFSLAQTSDNNLWQKAYKHDIILVSPSTLMAVLRVIENAWRFEKQNKNAKLIAKKAGDLYDKFYNFTLEMQKIERSLNKAQESYHDAFKKLSAGKGNLMQRAKELKGLEDLEEFEE